MRKVLTVALSAFIFTACTQSKKQSSATEFYSVFEIPDSLLTAEQESLKKELVDVVVNHLDYKDDKFIFQMTEEDFLKKGFAPEYYDIIIKDTDESNRVIESDDDLDWSKLLKDKIEEYKESKSSKADVGGIDDIPKDTLIELESFFGKPDSELTESQLEAKLKFATFLKKHLKVEDNQFVLNVEPQDFEKAGLSKYYYNLLKVRIAEVNNLVDPLGVEDLADKFKEGSIEYGFSLNSSEEGE